MKKIQLLIPKALLSFEESLVSKDVDVKLRSSIKLLESEGMLGPKKVEITSCLSVEQLKEIVYRVKDDVPEQTIIDGELVECR